MAPGPDNSSWHPAFMPNTEKDRAPAEPVAPQSYDIDNSGDPSNLEPSSPISDSNSYRPVSGRGDGQEVVESNASLSELSNLRNALTTSLASPGGVELDENPLHTDEFQPDAQEQKGDFPTAGPAHENKHASTVSFARTVSEPVDFGEEDEVDPTWNSHPGTSDPFEFMAKTERTNSFPQVPPTHTPQIAHQAPIPHSQVEDIMQEVEQETRDLFAEEDNTGDDFFGQQIQAVDDPEELVPEPQHHANDFGHESNDFGHHYASNVDQEVADEAQARFEEGLPLVQPEVEPDTEVPQFSKDPFGDGGNEDDFFTQVSKTAESSEHLPEPPPLARKSTMQVMGSIQFKEQEDSQDINEAEDAEVSPTALERATGGGIAVSASTVLSEVFGESEPLDDGAGEYLATSSLEPTDGDLAEKWKAALAEDEFLDDDDDFLPDDEDAESSNGKTLDPSDIFGSDDEGFLDDNDEQSAFPDSSQQASPPIPTAVRSPNGTVMGFDSLTGAVQSNRPSSSSSRYLPSNAAMAPQPVNNFAPAAPLFTNLSQQTASPAIPPAYISPTIQNFAPQQDSRPEMPKAQSFADKAKGGYSSPYDLPMEVVKPRKRPSTQQINRGYTAPAPPPNAPPPRSDSMHSTHSDISNSNLARPPSSKSQQAQLQMQPQPQPQPAKTVRKTQSGFFEELPMTARPKQALRNASSFVTSPTSTLTPPSNEFPLPPQRGPPNMQPIQPSSDNLSASPGLVAPDRVSPYASLPVGNTGNTVIPPSTSRYSPIPPPPSSQTAPPPILAQSRYSPAPPSQRQVSSSAVLFAGGAPPAVHAHQPRTSSPLAHFERSHDSRPIASPSEPSTFDRRSSSTYEPSVRAQQLPPTQEIDENQQINSAGASVYPQSASYSKRHSQTPPPSQGPPSRVTISPSKRATSNYLPQQPPPNMRTFVPPQRSQTQSPGSVFAGSKLDMSSTEPYQRPASTEAPLSPKVANGYQSMPTAPQSRPRGFSQGVNYIAPTDGREHDPLQRWRGAPVFAWGVGGGIITSFPKDVPRYGIGQAQPMIIRSPGEVKAGNIKDLDPLPDRVAQFPGPLKGKSKKKDVVTWLTAGIQTLEQDASYLRTLTDLSHEDKRVEERILLWKILRILIEHDGVLEGNGAIEKAVRDVLSPDIDDISSSTAPLYATGADLTGISHPMSRTKAEPVDPAAVDQIRKHLLRGEREKAVWEAVDKRLWAHAMLISNTVSRDLYKQVAQEFVQKEVKNTGDNTQSLAALYEIFAGNFEESIDELVPPSARAGFKMMSTSTTAGPSKDGLEGLDRWRETLGLVLSNRSPDDCQALNALGKLLSGYGRAEAAHICFLFARTHTVFGGIDNPETSMVLVGADHLRQPLEFDREIEPVLLSEVFEYGLTLSNTSSLAVSIPHLAVYKLQHATLLAQYGYRDNALQYCEAIASSITSQTRRSPYHHSLLVEALDDLNKRLKQSPKDGNSSWISKPSIDKVSGSVWATFNKFVAGDGDDAASNGSGPGSNAEFGPFARIAGGTPTISPSPSQSDLYGTYGSGSANQTNGIPIPATKASSRYAPGGSYTPPHLEQQNLYSSQTRNSFEDRPFNELQRSEPQRKMSDYRPTSQPANNYNPQASANYPPQASFTSHAAPDALYSPQLITPITDQPAMNLYESPPSLNSYEPHQQTHAASSRAPSSSYEPQPSSSYEPPSTSMETPEYGGYEPPSSSYEPPSYEPVAMDAEPDSPIDTRPKKKSFMDDDEDDIPMLKKQPPAAEKTKAEKDREADEAFRKAAEEDAAKAAQAPVKKGWGLGGWFGGGKKEPDMNQPNKPIRAKLGEASSFYYDPEQKRWINKKGGDTAPTPTATPPPPKAGPPRTASGPPSSAPSATLGGPTSVPKLGAAPPQRAVSETIYGSPPVRPDLLTDKSDNGLAPPAMMRSSSNGSATGPTGISRPPSAPPSRPGTGMSNASSIDDLLGPAMPRKGAKPVAKGKKKGRGYVDVMGEK